MSHSRPSRPLHAMGTPRYPHIEVYIEVRAWDRDGDSSGDSSAPEAGSTNMQNQPRWYDMSNKISSGYQCRQGYLP
jgi:hypothetical protein